MVRQIEAPCLPLLLVSITQDDQTGTLLPFLLERVAFLEKITIKGQLGEGEGGVGRPEGGEGRGGVSGRKGHHSRDQHEPFNIKSKSQVR